MTTRRRGGGDTVREVSPLQARLSQKDPAGSEGGRNMYKVWVAEKTFSVAWRISRGLMGSQGLEANSVLTWYKEEGNHTTDLPRRLYRYLLSSNSFYSQKCPSYDFLLQKSEQRSPGAIGVSGPAQKHPGKGKRELPAVTGMGCIFTGTRARQVSLHTPGDTRLHCATYKPSVRKEQGRISAWTANHGQLT